MRGMPSALALGSALASSGCLVPEAPEYGPPGQTTPIIEWQNVIPPLHRVLVLNHGDTPVGFSIPVRSEDAGEGLVLFLWVDYFTGGRRLRTWEAPPSTSSETRNIPATWEITTEVQAGCRQLSMFVTHFSNYDISTEKARDDRDVASVTWWANVNPASDPNTLVNCPGEASP